MREQVNRDVNFADEEYACDAYEWGLGDGNREYRHAEGTDGHAWEPDYFICSDALLAEE